MSAPVALVSFDEHLALILGTVSPLEPLELLLAEAHGALLAEDVIAASDLPSFDRALVDGYAVLLTDVAHATPELPAVLQVLGDGASGSTRPLRLQPGFSVRLRAGDALPPAAEAIVPAEWTDGGLASVAVHYAPGLLEHVRSTGSDLASGAEVLTVGTHLGAAQVGLLAAIGRLRVLAHPRPRVVVLSVGVGLVEVGEPLPVGGLFDTNSHALAAACREAGAVAYRIGAVGDDAQLLTEVLEDHLIQADAVVISADVRSREVLDDVLGRLGVMSVRRVAMDPGDLQGFGTVGPDATPLFVLPADSGSALVSFEVFVRPALRRMLGVSSWQRPLVGAVLTAPLAAVRGRRQYLRVQVGYDATKGYVASQISAPPGQLLSALAAANALLIVPEEVEQAPAGSTLSALLLDRRGG